MLYKKLGFNKNRTLKGNGVLEKVSLRWLPPNSRFSKSLNLLGVVFREAVNFRSKFIEIFEAAIDRGESNEGYFI